jgi:hypothetical protein
MSLSPETLELEQRFEAWWTAKQSASFREAYSDMPELHGGEREKRWGDAYKIKERAAFIAGAQAVAKGALP